MLAVDQSKDALFELINSMTKAEKGYFKKFASRHVLGEANNYVLLFDAIDKQKQYDPKQLLAQHREAAFAKHWRFSRHYLYQLILKSLSAFHSNKTVDSQLRNSIHQVEILFQKSLFKQCRKQLKKARKLAMQYEKQLALLEILNWEARLLKEMADSKGAQEYIEESVLEEEALLEDLRNMCLYKNKGVQLLWLLKNDPRGSNVLLKDFFTELAQLEEFQEEDKARSYRAKCQFYNINALYYRSKGDLKKWDRCTKDWLNMMAAYPDLVQEELQRLVSAVNNRFHALVAMSDLDGALATVRQLRPYLQDKQVPMVIAARIFANMFILEASILLQQENVAALPDLLEWLEAKNARYIPYIEPGNLLNIYYNAASGYFTLQAYEEALLWINKVLATTDINIRLDLQVNARLLNLLIHYELGNDRLIAYLVQSAHRFMDKRDELHAVELAVLKTMEQVSRLLPSESDRSLFETLLGEIKELMKDPVQQRAIHNTRLLQWIGRKAV